jgi:hemerythrin-like domain-containing protein
MGGGRDITRRIHDEHVATIGLIDRLERLLARAKPAAPPAADDPEGARVFGALGKALAVEVGRHFDFEQNRLFPLLAGGGDSDIAMLLTDEHDGIREVAGRLSAMLEAARAAGFAAPAWGEFHRLAREYVERQISHIQKEEMALLPMLDDALDDETDARLAEIYAKETA